MDPITPPAIVAAIACAWACWTDVREGKIYNALTLPMIDRARLGFDFTKMYWSADLVSGVRSDMVSDLRQRVEQTGQSRMIVCRCDTEDAMRLGWDLGVSLFQGRFIDQVLAEAKRIGPAAGRGPIIKTGAIGASK